MPRKVIEELWNSITHAFGFGMFLILLSLNSSISELVYCLGFMFVYAFSTLYHAMHIPTAKSVFRKLDMVSIHVIISITSISYLGFSTILPLLAVATFGGYGIWYVCKYSEHPVYRDTMVSVYVANGLLSTIIILYCGMVGNFYAFFLGLVLYLVGLCFYCKDKLLWGHAIWHTFVLLASLAHLIGIS